MSGTTLPSPAGAALRFTDVVVRTVLAGEAPAMPHTFRDLPDLARFLFHAIASDTKREEKLLDHVSFDVERGTCLALVGENGSGKTTIARACARLLKPAGGFIHVDGLDAIRSRGSDALAVRRSLHVLFDDVEAALDPRLTLAESFRLVEDALALDPSTRDARVEEALVRTRLAPELLQARPAWLTPGQRRCAALARALLAQPAAIVLDEPTGGLDPSDRALVLEALDALQGGPALLVLTGDLLAARRLARRAGVLVGGSLVELDDVEKVLRSPAHPHTQALVAATPGLRLRN
jgi:ABC-type glutathione transport system ATPase component